MDLMSLRKSQGLLANAAVILFDTTDVAWRLCHQFTNDGIWQLNRKYSHRINALQMLAVCIQSEHNKKCHSFFMFCFVLFYFILRFVPRSASITHRTILINTARYTWYITRCSVLFKHRGT